MWKFYGNPNPAVLPAFGIWRRMALRRHLYH
jgi:hypothetical protein